jgi:protein-S-isoprenylcysteine O-methyltransferase Ste14
VGFIAYIQCFQIVPEERALKMLFGSEFERYQSKVRRWL